MFALRLKSWHAGCLQQELRGAIFTCTQCLTQGCHPLPQTTIKDAHLLKDYTFHLEQVQPDKENVCMNALQ